MVLCTLLLALSRLPNVVGACRSASGLYRSFTVRLELIRLEVEVCVVRFLFLSVLAYVHGTHKETHTSGIYLALI